MGRDELLRNEESRRLTVELDATRCVSGARGRGERLSEAAKTVTSDRVLELGEANETIRWAWDRAKVDQKDMDERRNSWPSWRQSRAGKELRTDDERDRCRRLRRSEQARRWNGNVDQPTRNDIAWPTMMLITV